jgi:serine/threonine protein kinase
MGPLKCLHCQTPLNLADETLDRDMSCPTCGSRAPLGDPTAKRRPATVRRVGRFELLEEVGRGQFGSVWRALDSKLNRIVALKTPRREVLDLHTRNMFLREANAAAALSHSNIVGVYEVFEEDGQVHIVSEFIYGDDLKLVLCGETLMGVDEIARFMMTTARAVHYAHDRGVIHRDLKPGNILVDESLQPHVTDFGLAKIASHESTLTVYGDQPVGTLSYMSPEQAAGNVHGLDCRSDVFSLGVILYEMLTRQRPFPGVSLDILDKVRHAEPVPPRQIKPDLPQGLETICLRALMKEPAERYSTAGEMAEDLQRYLNGEPTLARPLTPADIAIRWIQKNLAFAAVCMVALFSTAAAAMSIYNGQSGTPDAADSVEVAPAVSNPSRPLTVQLTTDPPGAEIVFIRLDPVTAMPTGKSYRPGRTPVTVSLPRADYRVVARLDDGRFHEVIRHVPMNPNANPEGFPHRLWDYRRGIVVLPDISIPNRDVNRGMVAFSGTAPQLDPIPPFELDPMEVTIADFRRAYRGTIPGEMQISGVESDQVPMTGTLYDYAVAYAEMVGKRLPTEMEYEFAATNGGTTRFPWGDEEHEISDSLVSVGTIPFDRTQTEPPVFGLFSNGAEMTGTQYVFDFGGAMRRPSASQGQLLDSFVVRGGLSQLGSQELIQEQGSRLRSGMARKQRAAHAGFRCARSQIPNWPQVAGRE